MQFFDTHAHLSYEPLVDSVAQIIADAQAVGVSQIAAIATELRSSLQCVALAEQHEGVFASVGVHPTGCHQATTGQWNEIVDLLKHPKVVALGETGLDCYWDDCPLPIQQLSLIHI